MVVWRECGNGCLPAYLAGPGQTDGSSNPEKEQNERGTERRRCSGRGIHRARHREDRVQPGRFIAPDNNFVIAQFRSVQPRFKWDPFGFGVTSVNDR